MRSIGRGRGISLAAKGGMIRGPGCARRANQEPRIVRPLLSVAKWLRRAGGFFPASRSDQGE